ncbi:MAG: macro domain-containing protein [Myxococcaceae bacterium]
MRERATRSAMADIALRQGSLTQGDDSVLVNASNTNGQLGTGVSAAIRKACGAGFQTKISSALERRCGGPMRPGEVLVTDAGSHPRAKFVVHVAVMDYREGFTGASFPTHSTPFVPAARDRGTRWRRCRVTGRTRSRWWRSAPAPATWESQTPFASPPRRSKRHSFATRWSVTETTYEDFAEVYNRWLPSGSAGCSCPACWPWKRPGLGLLLASHRPLGKTGRELVDDR